MSNQYRAVHPSLVALHGVDVFDHEFADPWEERDALERGWFELAPRPYRVLHDHYTVDGQPVAQGTVVEAAFPMEIEHALLAGGHLERVRRDAKPDVVAAAPEEADAALDIAEAAESESPPPKKAPAKRAARTKE